MWMKRILYVLFLFLCLTACTAQTDLAPAPVNRTESPAAVVVPSPVVESTSPATPAPVMLTAPRVVPVPLPVGMVMEEYQLLGLAHTEGRDFIPLVGDQAQILAIRADQREQPDPALASLDPNDTTRLHARLDGKDIFAQTETVTGLLGAPEDILRVFLGKEEIYTMPLGWTGPVPSLRGLWVYDGHWVVEAAKADPAYDMPLGQIILDGELLNEKFNYDEAFEFQTMAGRPFYFFKRHGKIGAVYDGQEIPLDYDVLPHYYCCSGAAFNPLAACNMVSFFAQRQGRWYYVEIGVYEPQP